MASNWKDNNAFAREVLRFEDGTRITICRTPNSMARLLYFLRIMPERIVVLDEDNPSPIVEMLRSNEVSTMIQHYTR